MHTEHNMANKKPSENKHGNKILSEISDETHRTNATLTKKQVQYHSKLNRNVRPTHSMHND